MRESHLQTAIINLLQYEQNKKTLYFIRNNSGAVRTDTGRYIRFGRRGSADIIVFKKGGQVEWWEIKTPKGRLNENQKEFKTFIEELGYIYKIIRSVDDIQL